MYFSGFSSFIASFVPRLTVFDSAKMVSAAQIFCVPSVCGKYSYISQWRSLQKCSNLIILAENFSRTVGQTF